MHIIFTFIDSFNLDYFINNLYKDILARARGVMMFIFGDYTDEVLEWRAEFVFYFCSRIGNHLILFIV